MPALIQKNVSLQAHNSMAVAAYAEYLAVVSSVDEIHRALDFAKQNSLPTLVLGEGSNTLFTQDYRGLLILNRLKGIELIEQSQQAVIIKAASGENWHDFVTYTIQQGWNGLENLALIPGLLGAAPIQNIGAYGVELKNRLLELEYLNIDSRELHTLQNAECHFAYRDSIFKKALAGKTIITSVTLKLKSSTSAEDDELNLSYPALAERFATSESVTAKQVFAAVCEIRRNKLPMPAEVPNTGSFFKNPIVSHQQHERLRKQFPELVSYPFDGHFKLAAAWLIEKAGWKRKSIDGVCVHPHQALVITNPDGASGASVLRFARAVQKDIEDKFAVQLEIEPQLV